MRTGSLGARLGRLERAMLTPEFDFEPLDAIERMNRIRAVLASPSLVCPAAYARIVEILDGARTRMRAAHGIH